MARAQTTDDWPEAPVRGHDNNWQALRSDLVALLDHVEREVSQTSSRPNTNYAEPAPSAYSGHAHPARGDSPQRRQEALKSVNRAMERFADSGDESVAYAVEQIRGTHRQPSSPQTPHNRALDSAIEGLTNRLNHIEGDLRDRGQRPGNPSDVGSQIAQLTHVVELLAEAVGDNSQVRRLEAQIGNIARLVEQKPSDDGSIADRIDRLSASVAKIVGAQDAPMNAIEALAVEQKDGLSAIEAGIRNIYDRIDAIEQANSSQHGGAGALTDQITWISDEMGALTQAMKSGGDTSKSILSRIDALNTRVGDIEAVEGSGTSGHLRDDVAALRNSVEDAIEIRFATLQDQIGQIDRKLSQAPEAQAVAGGGQLEEKLEKLISRLDETGARLTDISKQQGGNNASQGQPDFDALAETVAQRASEAVGRNAPKSVSLSPESLSQLERTMQRLLSAASTPAAPQHADQSKNSDNIDARLHRLEAKLNHGGARTTPPPAKVEDAAPNNFDATPNTAKAPASAPVFAATPNPFPAADEQQISPTRSTNTDTMRSHPADEGPLADAPDKIWAAADEQLADRAAQQAARMHPARIGFKAEVSDEVSPPKPEVAAPPPVKAPSGFDPANADRPTKPKSSLFEDVEPSFEAKPSATNNQQMRVPASAETNHSRNTFIEAARKAARTTPPAENISGAQSLIAKALSRFQFGRGSDESDTPSPIAAPVHPRAEARVAPVHVEPEADNVEPRRPRTPKIEDADDDIPQTSVVTQARGFLGRHRRLLLLGAALLVTSLLAVNLIQKRLGDSDATTAPAVQSQVSPSTDAPEISGQALLDPEPTGSVDPFVRMVLPPISQLNQDLPVALSDAARAMVGQPDDIATGAIPDTSSALPNLNDAPTLTGVTGLSPQPGPEALDNTPAQPGMAAIQVEMPPEDVGPLELRQAAAGGDARAQFEIAAIYSEGQAVKQDFSAAAVWYERAAAQGFAPAEYRLGNLYEHGQGTAKDLEQAKLWYLRAAEAGNRMSMHNLAALYASGALGKQEFSLAAEWFERAASRGLTDSQFNLGMLYARGLGVPQNMAASYKWFSLAAAQNDPDAGKARDDVARSLDPETIAKISEEIANWRRVSMDIKANFAPIGTWTKNFNPGETIGDKRVVEKVQAALGRLGYDVGIPDGLMGPRTRDAIKLFEKATGMTESGAVNPRLLAVLSSQPV